MKLLASIQNRQQTRSIEQVLCRSVVVLIFAREIVVDHDVVDANGLPEIDAAKTPLETLAGGFQIGLRDLSRGSFDIERNSLAVGDVDGNFRAEDTVFEDGVDTLAHTAIVAVADRIGRFHTGNN